uniref:hypothetical protein n=1 Tax=Flavobacterium sp. TaxID=239 RepID=UPI0040470D74
IKDVLDEFRNSLVGQIISYLPNGFAQNLLFDYIEKQAEDYCYAAHVILDRDIEKAGEALVLSGKIINLIKETKYTKYAVAAVIYGLVVITIIIDVLVIYLTRGRSLAGRAKKIQKVLRKVKALEKALERKGDVDIDIIPPSIAVNAGMYYKQLSDRRVAMFYEVNVKASPLLAIEIKKEFDLLSLMDKGIDAIKAKLPNDKKVKEELKKNEPNNSKIKQKLNDAGLQVTGVIIVTGEIGFEHKVAFNLLTQEYSILDILGKGIINAKNEILLKTQIKFDAKITGTYKKEFIFYKLQTNIDGKLNIKMNGAMGIKMKYGYTPEKGLFLQPILYFSGIKGIYSGELKSTSRIFGYEFETSDEIKPTPFTLLEPFEMDLMTMKLFNHKKNDW